MVISQSLEVVWLSRARGERENQIGSPESRGGPTKRWIVAAAALWAGGAQAQTLVQPSGAVIGSGNGFFSNLLPGNTGAVDFSRDYVAVGRQFQNVVNSNGVAVGDVFVPDFGYLPLSTVLGSQAQSQANSVALVTIANRLDRFADRFREGIALAGSINVLPPNEGDRFAVSFGGAGYDGTGAGSVAISARVGDAIVYGALARGPTQSLVKGGVGWSFR